jgi:hypothetical protein
VSDQFVPPPGVACSRARPRSEKPGSGARAPSVVSWCGPDLLEVLIAYALSAFPFGVLEYLCVGMPGSTGGGLDAPRQPNLSIPFCRALRAEGSILRFSRFLDASRTGPDTGSTCGGSATETAHSLMNVFVDLAAMIQSVVW